MGVAVGAGVTVGIAASSSLTCLATRASTVASRLGDATGTGVGGAGSSESWGTQARVRSNSVASAASIGVSGLVMFKTALKKLAFSFGQSGPSPV